jgi:hypothetical protein
MSIEQGAAVARTTKKQRVSAENRYPMFDLNASLLLARAVKEKGGNACTPEQLGGYLGVKNTTGGSFVGRVAAAKAFGLIRTVQGRYEITERAEAILYHVTDLLRDQALRDAFLAIPLYRQVYDRFKGQSLPQEFGLRNLLHTQYGIPSGDRVTAACRVMMDSAETGGFYRAHNGARTHLVDPVQGTPSYATPPRDQGAPPDGDRATLNGGGGGGGGNGSSGVGLPSRGKLLDGMWEELPADPQWDEESLGYWLDTFERLLRVRYKCPKS